MSSGAECHFFRSALAPWNLFIKASEMHNVSGEETLTVAFKTPDRVIQREGLLTKTNKASEPDWNKSPHI